MEENVTLIIFSNMDNLFLYILGALINSWFICTWFFTSLPLHLFKPFIKKEDEIYSWEDWNNWLMLKNDFIAELLGCPLCLGFWSSVIISNLVANINELDYKFILAGAFTWPLIAFVFYKKLEK